MSADNGKQAVHGLLRSAQSKWPRSRLPLPCCTG